MATLDDLTTTGALIKHTPFLERNELPMRVAYLAPAFDNVLDDTWRTMDCVRGSQLSPYEQIEQMFYELVIGRVMSYNVGFKKLDPVSASVWELKTRDVRIFGWFPARAHFVAVCAQLRSLMPNRADFSPFVDEVLAFRSALNLDEPKAITGTKYSDVF